MCNSEKKHLNAAILERIIGLESSLWVVVTCVAKQTLEHLLFIKIQQGDHVLHHIFNDPPACSVSQHATQQRPVSDAGLELTSIMYCVASQLGFCSIINRTIEILTLRRPVG